MSLLSFLRHADFVTTILVDTMVLVFSFSAYRLTKMRAFGFLILGSAIGIISEAALQFYRARSYTSPDDALAFYQIYRAGYVVASISWGVGIYQLIQFVVSRFQTNDKMMLEPTAAVPSVLDEPGNPKAGDKSTSASGGGGSSLDR
jgi:hypothetical protein